MRRATMQSQAVREGPPKPWTLEEKPGDTLLTLERQFNGETIQVAVSAEQARLPPPQFSMIGRAVGGGVMQPPRRWGRAAARAVSTSPSVHPWRIYELRCSSRPLLVCF